MEDIRELYKAAGMMDESGQLLDTPRVKKLTIEVEVMPTGVEFNEYGVMVVSFETRLPNIIDRPLFSGEPSNDPNFEFKMALDNVKIKP